MIDRGIARHDHEIVDSNEDKEKNKNKDPFNNLAVPAGILLIVQQPSQSEYEKKSYANNKSQNCDMLSDDIYDKLFEYASFKGTNKGKNKGTNKKITRNNKKVHAKIAFTYYLFPLSAWNHYLPECQVDTLANVEFGLGDFMLPKLLHGSSHDD